MRGGGYDDQSFWSDVDWAWIKDHNISHPHFWLVRQGQWFYRAMFEEIPLPLDWPVYVSHAEASAYARFVGKSLPTEAQFHRAAYGTPEGTERAYPWGDELPDATRGNFDFQRWDPVAVGSTPGGRSAFGLEDALGNGWEWTSTPFAPLPGFEPFPFYSRLLGKLLRWKALRMKGASPRTAACMLRRSFRNWFQPHYPYVYASFRCVRTEGSQDADPRWRNPDCQHFRAKTCAMGWVAPDKKSCRRSIFTTTSAPPCLKSLPGFPSTD